MMCGAGFGFGHLALARRLDVGPIDSARSLRNVLVGQVGHGFSSRSELIRSVKSVMVFQVGLN
jgi:hypothetical protein